MSRRIAVVRQGVELVTAPSNFSAVMVSPASAMKRGLLNECGR